MRQLERRTAEDREKRGAARSALIRRDAGKLSVLQDALDLIARLEAHNAGLEAALKAVEEGRPPAPQPPRTQRDDDSGSQSGSSDSAPPLDSARVTAEQIERHPRPPPPHRPARPSSPPSLSTSSESSSSPLPVRLSDYLARLSSQQSLYSLCLDDSRIALLLVDADSGIGLDANSAYFSHSQFTRYQLTHTCVTAPYSAVMQAEQGRYRVQKRGRRAEEEGDALLVAQGIKQWPSSVLTLRALLEEGQGTATAVWRCKGADLRVWERTWTMWVAKTDWAVDDAGQAVRRPVQLVYAAGLDEPVLVSEGVG